MTTKTRVKIALQHGVYGYAVYAVSPDGTEEFREWLSSFGLVNQRYPDASLATLEYRKTLPAGSSATRH